MRLILSVVVAVVLIAPTPGAASEPRLDILKDVHAQACPSEAPCNYCSIYLRDGYWLPECGPVNDPWGAECRCKSRSGWQDGKVMTIYPDKPFTVNY